MSSFKLGRTDLAEGRVSSSLFVEYLDEVEEGHLGLAVLSPSSTGLEESGLRAQLSRKTSIRNHKGIVVAKKMSRKVSRRVVRPACIAGVRSSRPNFRAPCGKRRRS